MFGYIRIGKNELSNENFLRFKAYYCGLCKAMGKYSHISRLGLSYDMTFLTLLLSAVSEEKETIVPSRCILHPFKKEHAVKGTVVDYTAAMSILLVYKKLEDDWNDDKSIRALAGKIIYLSAARKISVEYKETADKISECLRKLSVLEKENCTDIDETADCFAKICETLFAPDFIADKNTKKVLSWIGYNIGRWIYIIDAYDDAEKDIKKQSYNPFKERYKENPDKLRRDTEAMLTYNLASISAAYDLLNINRNDEIIRNILYSGMGGMQNKILNLWEEKDESLRSSRCKSE